MFNTLFTCLLVLTLSKAASKTLTSCSLNSYNSETEEWSCSDEKLKMSSLGCTCSRQFDTTADNFDVSQLTKTSSTNCDSVSCNSEGLCTITCACKTRRLLNLAQIDTLTKKCSVSGLYTLVASTTDETTASDAAVVEDAAAEDTAAVETAPTDDDTGEVVKDAPSDTNDEGVEEKSSSGNDDEVVKDTPSDKVSREDPVIDVPEGAKHGLTHKSRNNSSKSSSGNSGWRVMTIIVLVACLCVLVVYCINRICMKYNEDNWSYYKEIFSEWLTGKCDDCKKNASNRQENNEDRTPFLKYGSNGTAEAPFNN